MESRRREVSPRKSRKIAPIKEVVFKFLVIGDYGVGKTAIVRRYIEGKFTSNYKITIGADFSLKTIQWDPNTRVSIQLWDIAGHERFNYMTRVYYKYAVGCAIVFDVTRQSTFASVKKWLEDVREKVFLDDGRDIPVILLANKSDIDEQCVSPSSISKYTREAGILQWFQTSAKSNTNISEAISALVEAALEMNKPPEKIPDVIAINNNDHTNVRYEEEPCCR